MSTLDDALIPAPGRELHAAHRGAEQAVRAAAKGEKRWCSRAKAFVSPPDCLSRHAAALAAGGYNPCLECATVATLVRKNGGPMPKVLALKKETPPAPKQTTPADPFAGWSKYELKPGPCRREQPAAYLADASLRLNAAALTLIDAASVKTVDVFFRPGRIGLGLRQDKDGVLALTPEKKRGDAATLSARGLVKLYGLEKAVGRLYAVRRIADNALEVDLGQEAKS